MRISDWSSDVCSSDLFTNGELAGAVRGPVPGLWLAGLARNHLDALRNHEGRIEADAELANQRHVLAGIAGQAGEEFAGARAGDGAKIGHQLVAVHADEIGRASCRERVCKYV